MVFTTFGFAGAYDVNAAQGDESLIVKVVDADGKPIKGIKLEIKGVEEGQSDFTFDGPDKDADQNGISNENGILEWEYVSEGTIMSKDEYDITISGGTAYTFDPVRIVFAETDQYDDVYIETVGGSEYTYSETNPYVITLTQVWTTDFDFNTDTTYDWESYGIDYATIDFDKDLIVDVRNTTKEDGGAPFIDLSKAPHFVFSNPDAVDVTQAAIVAGDGVAKKLDAVYKKADDAGKRVVLICYGGMTFAKRAMQYYNTQGKSLGPNGKVTYLKKGANGVLTGENKDYKANLGIGFNDITSNDVILDVRSKANYDKGHLAGSVHVDVTDEGGKLSDKDKTDMVAALTNVPSGARLVIVCNSGNSLAYKAMAYFMADKTDTGKENLKKVAYLIGGAAVIDPSKMVTDDNPPAPAVVDGQTAVVDGNTYTVSSAAAQTAVFTKAKKGKKATVAATIAVNGVTLNVVGIAPKAFKGTKTKTITVKTKLLTKASVKGSLKGSKVKTIKVKVGKKKENKNFVKKYKKYFTKKNAGKKVSVK